MTVLQLTREDILNDIEGYQDRLHKKKDKLNGLPAELKGSKIDQARRLCSPRLST